MGFRRCEREDPFTKRVRHLYGANVVRAPRAGIDPLDALAVRKRRVESRGKFVAMLAGGDLPALPSIESAAAAGISGLRSASVDLDAGLSLSASFLIGLGVPVPGASLDADLWRGASSVSFEVRDVQENKVDVNLLAQALSGRSIQRDQLANGVFFNDAEVRLLVITRTLTSPCIAIQAAGSRGQSVKVNVDGVAELVGKADAKIAWSLERDDSIVFCASTAATFAFGVVPCAVQANGRFTFGLEADGLTFGEPQTDPDRPIETKPIVSEDGLLTFD